jgi:putative YhdH/YhfP family quinone oxidoreductase
MMEKTFKAYRVEREGGAFKGAIEQVDASVLPDGDVTIEVAYSSLNYKDALSAKGHPGVSRKFPHTPGIDAAGAVAESNDPRFKEGNAVLVTGYDLGMNTPGGFARYIRVPAGWVVPLPEGLTLRESMILGTAGFTAGLCVTALVHNGMVPDGGPVLVTGAGGGVGCLSVALLSALGFEVVAGTGRDETREFLKKLGAASFVAREELAQASERPLLSARWQCAIDNVGGTTLENILKSLKPYGSVASVGLVDRPEFRAAVFPFILRSNNILGVASAETPMGPRLEVWKNLAGHWKINNLEELATEVPLAEVDKAIERILAGKTLGRILVKVE